jgi:ribosomal protein L24
VELCHLNPVLPKKKGDLIVIISGDHQGVVMEVIACKTKASKAEVVINGAKVALNFSDICRPTKPD